jgi:hypothetical protein
MKFTNNSNIPLALAVWAVDDDYDFVNDPKYFSVTSLLKPVRQIVLTRRLDMDSVSMDLENLLSIAMGKSIHTAIEKAWKENHQKNMEILGYPKEFIDKIKVNPKEVKEGDVPCYIEQRNIREFNGYKIGGKFDSILDGMLNDYKSTTTYKWTTGSSDEDYRLQGSLYRWLNQDKVKEDFIRINFVFTDWSKLSAMKDKNYPQCRVAFKDYPLLSIQETEQFLQNKLDQIKQYKDAPDSEIPECTDEELWRTPTKYKYYANEDSTRATKNFDSLAEANKFKAEKGKGIIRIVPGEARRCNYCSAATICEQYRRIHGSE